MTEARLSPDTEIDALAKIIWLAGFDRAFDRTPTDPWENQNDAVKNTHRDTARKVMAAGYIPGRAQQQGSVTVEARDLNQLELLEAAGYDSTQVHPLCYKNFSHVKFTNNVIV